MRAHACTHARPRGPAGPAAAMGIAEGSVLPPPTPPQWVLLWVQGGCRGTGGGGLRQDGEKAGGDTCPTASDWTPRHRVAHSTPQHPASFGTTETAASRIPQHRGNRGIPQPPPSRCAAPRTAPQHPVPHGLLQPVDPPLGSTDAAASRPPGTTHQPRAWCPPQRVPTAPGPPFPAMRPPVSPPQPRQERPHAAADSVPMINSRRRHR